MVRFQFRGHTCLSFNSAVPSQCLRTHTPGPDLTHNPDRRFHLRTYVCENFSVTLSADAQLVADESNR